MSTQQTITAYYDDLADRYDTDRFGNTYGQYLHRQEKALLSPYLPLHQLDQHLDLGCGTGRFLEFADHGLDVSQAMVKTAAAKFPQKDLQVGDATNLPFADGQFERIFSIHVFMHLSQPVVSKILLEAHRVLRTGGLLLFDIPSLTRRNLIRYKAPSDWHGAFAMDQNVVHNMIANRWEIQACHGIAMLPIHRIPGSLRKPLIALDTMLCRTPLKAYSSYLLFVLRKK
ncbi:MAG: methyltransferase domain-containing protein [Bacteroidota bacterium]